MFLFREREWISASTLARHFGGTHCIKYLPEAYREEHLATGQLTGTYQSHPLGLTVGDYQYHSEGDTYWKQAGKNITFQNSSLSGIGKAQGFSCNFLWQHWS